MLLSIRHLPRQFALTSAALWLISCGAALCAAQSSDLARPSPVYTEQLAGRIAPRDIGDPRRTRHFYIFRGTEGDLTVSIESVELNGAVDVFTATTQRPLLQVTLYGGTATNVTKSVFLRREETLILRVEARAAGDVEGTYRIQFGGSFAPAPAGLAQAPETSAPETAADTRRDRNTRRVTSTGARIEEPRREVTPAEEASANPTPRPAGTSTESAEERPPTPRRERPGTRRGRAARNTPSRTNTPRPERRPAETTRGAEAAESTAPAATPSAETARESESDTRGAGTRSSRTPTPRRRGASRRNTPAERAVTTKPVEVPPAAEAPSTRLIIVLKDGETFEREMSTVRRVTVENNQVVVLTRDGKTIRQPLANVVKMSIEP